MDKGFYWEVIYCMVLCWQFLFIGCRHNNILWANIDTFGPFLFGSQQIKVETSISKCTPGSHGSIIIGKVYTYLEGIDLNISFIRHFKLYYTNLKWRDKYFGIKSCPIYLVTKLFILIVCAVSFALMNETHSIKAMSKPQNPKYLIYGVIIFKLVIKKLRCHPCSY